MRIIKEELKTLGAESNHLTYHFIDGQWGVVCNIEAIKLRQESDGEWVYLFYKSLFAILTDNYCLRLQQRNINQMFIIKDDIKTEIKFDMDFGEVEYNKLIFSNLWTLSPGLILSGE